jgi:tetrapyrrole methylase family protein/MazG family protein
MSKFNDLLEIVRKLRGPGGCPWDKAQTHKSLTPYAIEEALELEEAIHNQDTENLKEELGDLLFQSVLHAEVARQNGDFDIEDVIEHLNHKMVSRHPHVFADRKVSDADEVVKNWEEIKAAEKGDRGEDLFAIPRAFPALLRSHKIGKRSKKVDFDWDRPEQVLAEVQSEFAELQEALQADDLGHIEEELGDVLFTLAQLARHLNLDAEKALRLSNSKFIRRFHKMLELQPDFSNLSRDDKEALWHRAKMALKNPP